MLVMSKTRRIRALAAALAMLAMCGGAAGAAQVIVKPNPKDPTAGDVWLKKSPTAKGVKLRTVRNALANRFGDYKNGSLYIIKRLGEVPQQGHSDKWTDELWRYTGSGRGTKLFAAQGLDFRVRDDGGMIAVLASAERGTYRRTLYLLARDAKVVKVWRPGQLASFVLDFVKSGWAGRDLWLQDIDESSISGFVGIDSRSWKVKKYGISRLGLDNLDYDLNTSTLRLAYGDCPLTLDIEGRRELEKRKTPVKLHVYNLKTRHSRIIARAIADLFNPKWIGPRVLEYDNPKGKGRVRKVVGTI